MQWLRSHPEEVEAIAGLLMPRCGHESPQRGHQIRQGHRSARERVDALVAERKELSRRLEDHERRLMRIETLIEFSQERRRDLPKS